MDTSINRLSLACALCVALLVLGSSPMSGQNVPCHEVLRELHRSELGGRIRGTEAGRVAAKLRTSSAWVDRCATVYGRRLKDREQATKRRESQEPIWELHEPGEIGREELEAGEVVIQSAPYKDKARLRAFVEREEDWQPFQANEWQPNPGKKWSPYLYDPHRTVPDDVPGIVRD